MRLTDSHMQALTLVGHVPGCGLDFGRLPPYWSAAQGPPAHLKGPPAAAAPPTKFSCAVLTLCLMMGYKSRNT